MACLKTTHLDKSEHQFFFYMDDRNRKWLRCIGCDEIKPFEE